MALNPPTFAKIRTRCPLNGLGFLFRRRRGKKRGAMAPAMRFQGVDEDLQKILDANMDEVPARRRAREAFKDIQLGIDHCLLKMTNDRLKVKELYEVNSRGLETFSKSWLPETSPMKAVVCYCHGYGDTCTFFFEGIARRLASSGYGVFALDYPGFGLSEGLHGYIPSFDRIVDDVIEHFSKIKEKLSNCHHKVLLSSNSHSSFLYIQQLAYPKKANTSLWMTLSAKNRIDKNPEYQSLPSFLFGQSMGGAVALKVHLKQPNAWDGAILVAPMCKIAEDMVPPWLVTQFLIGVAKFLPKKKLVPQKDLAEMAFRELKKRGLTPYNVIAYKDKPRLKTAVELLKTTEEIERRLEEVSLPLLILHGEADVVTDPSVSKALYDKARSSDKKLCLYQNAYHSLLEGEPDEMVFRVLDDIISWLDEHSTRNTSC